MRVILLALALCVIAFALNLVGDFSVATSDAAQAPTARASIAPAGASAPVHEPVHETAHDLESLNKR
ncbi:MAG: hypothetical protein GC206_04155 [Alphaproteobacteria bacterium]|nr:hypothetical protein [Alphaproteobacteria bacterium]